MPKQSGQPQSTNQNPFPSPSQGFPGLQQPTAKKRPTASKQKSGSAIWIIVGSVTAVLVLGVAVVVTVLLLMGNKNEPSLAKDDSSRNKNSQSANRPDDDNDQQTTPNFQPPNPGPKHNSNHASDGKFPAGKSLFNYTIQLPDGYQSTSGSIETSDQVSIRWTGVALADTTFPIVDLAIAKFPEGLNLSAKQIAESQSLEKAKYFTNFQASEISKIRVGDVDYMYFEWTGFGKQSRRPMKGRLYSVCHNGSNLLFAFDAVEKHYPNYEKDFQSIIESYQVK